MKNLPELCLEIATKYHAGQTRWDKKTPYINHPIEVARLSKELFPVFHGYCDSVDIEIVESVSNAHDLIEDCDINLEQFENLLVKEFPDYNSQNKIREIIEGVRAITKNPDKNVEQYLNYILRVKNNKYARIVKICDIAHNSFDLKNGSMKDKYLLARYILEN